MLRGQENEKKSAKGNEKEQPMREEANQEKYLLSWKTVKKMFEERTSHATYKGEMRIENHLQIG